MILNSWAPTASGRVLSSSAVTIKRRHAETGVRPQIKPLFCARYPRLAQRGS